MAHEPQRSESGVAGAATPGPSNLVATCSAALGFFALEPFNFAIPVLGVVDDLFLLPLLLHGLAKIAALTTFATTSRPRDDRVVSVHKVLRSPGSLAFYLANRPAVMRPRVPMIRTTSSDSHGNFNSRITA